MDKPIVVVFTTSEVKARLLPTTIISFKDSAKGSKPSLILLDDRLLRLSLHCPIYPFWIDQDYVLPVRAGLYM